MLKGKSVVRNRLKLSLKVTLVSSLARNTVALASLGSVFKSGTHRELIQLAMRVSAGYVIAT